MRSTVSSVESLVVVSFLREVVGLVVIDTVRKGKRQMNQDVNYGQITSGDVFLCSGYYVRKSERKSGKSDNMEGSCGD